MPMMASQHCPPSSRSRYGPVVAVVATAAVAYGAYLIWQINKTPTGSPLRRSHAIRRRHRRPGEHNAEPQTENPLPAQVDGIPEPAEDDNRTEQSWGDHLDSAEALEGQNIKKLLYHIAEEQARIEGYIHRGVSCNLCDTKPIRGIRWRCMNCPDFDLCSDCEAQNAHPKTHIFCKIRIPAPTAGPYNKTEPVQYPGRPELAPRQVPHELKKRLGNGTRYELAELDGLWDQFTCLANTPWVDDPNKLEVAIDRSAFDQSFIPFPALRPPHSTLIYDRYFSFFDTNDDGLIGFEEFLRALAVLHHKVDSDPDARLHVVFNGYDIDGDGWVDRKDFLRIFRSFFVIQQEVTRIRLAEELEELSAAGALDIIHSSQPLSSAFTEHPILPQDANPPNGKQPDQFGDLVPPRVSRVVLPDSDDTVDRGEVIENAERWRTGTVFDMNTGEPTDFHRDHLLWTPESPVPRAPRRPESFTSDAVNERRRRRAFYTDAEEGQGLGPPNGANGQLVHGTYRSTNDTGSPSARDAPDSSDSGRPTQRSRTSSKVHFQDDPDFDTHSTTSTASRPVGERWGGYEVPTAEKDLGKDILYQVTQQGCNELLDIMFKEREDLWMKADETKAEREKWRDVIDDFVQRQKARKEHEAATAADPLLATAQAAEQKDGENKENTEEEPRGSSSSSSNQENSSGDPTITSEESNNTENALDPEIMVQPLSTLLQQSGYSIADDTPTSGSNRSPSPPRPWSNGADVTLPQHRPNTEAEWREMRDWQLRERRRAQRRNASTERALPDRAYEETSLGRDTDTYLEVSHGYGPSGDRETYIDAQPMPEGSFPPVLGGEFAHLMDRNSPAQYLIKGEGSWGMKMSGEEDGPDWLKKGQREGDGTPDDKWLQSLALLDQIEQMAKDRGGPGRIGFDEFKEMLESPTGRQRLAFVEEWLSLGGY